MIEMFPLTVLLSYYSEALGYQNEINYIVIIT
jgi:hypothetical protein